VRARVPGIGVEVLTPDFRGRVARALDALSSAWPDVFNHNIETVPSLYRAARPGADYRGSLELLAQAKAARPALVTKSGLMLGLGERDDEVRDAARPARTRGRRADARPVSGAVRASPAGAALREPRRVRRVARRALALGFREVVAGPLVRSSYHAADVLKPA
jgi:lipoic acid synthetase